MCMHINPDFHLETAHGRLFSVMRNRIAWEKCFEQLMHGFEAVIYSKFYILIGCQASGKTTWAKQLKSKESDGIILDALLIQEQERKFFIALAKKYNCECIAVWLDTPLEVSLKLNQKRPYDERIDFETIVHIYKLLQPPTVSEGFDSVIRIIFKE